MVVMRDGGERWRKRDKVAIDLTAGRN